MIQESIRATDWSLIIWILGVLFTLVCGSFVYTNRGIGKIWSYLRNDWHDDVKAVVRAELHLWQRKNK